MKHNYPNPNLSPPLGRVYLVGSGPGDPGLLTLRAVQCLQKADLIIADRLVHPRIATYAKPGSEILYFRHTLHCDSIGANCPSSPGFSSDEILSKIIEYAKNGKVVVHLKGGDPELFARQSEELAALREAGIPYEIVPGITAGLAASDYAELPLTHPEWSSAVALLTGHEPSNKQRPPLPYDILAQFPGTLIVYMGEDTSSNWQESLIRGGMSPQTPVAIVCRCSWPDQHILRCQLGNLQEVIAQKDVQTPAVIIVGEVVRLAPERSWFEARPLFGQRILLTRPEDQALSIIDSLSELGAEVFVQPAILIADPPHWQPVDEALNRLDSYDWVVFSSANGVRYLLDRLLHQGGDMRRLAWVQLAAIGAATAAQLARYHLRADLVPAEYRAEVLAEALAPQAAGKRFLLVRANRGREVLPERLRTAGALVEQIVAYSSTDVAEPDLEIAQLLAAGRIDWVTVTSSSIARSLVRMFGEALRRSKLASISPITSAVLRELGYPPAVESQAYTLPGLVEAILQAVKEKPPSASKG